MHTCWDRRRCGRLSCWRTRRNDGSCRTRYQWNGCKCRRCWRRKCRHCI